MTLRQHGKQRRVGSKPADIRPRINGIYAAQHKLYCISLVLGANTDEIVFVRFIKIVLNCVATP